MIEYDVFDAIKDNDLKALESFAAFIASGGCAWSPLHEAAKLGRTELLKFILKQRFVHINDSFEIGEPDDFRSGTALTEALMNGHVDTAIFLIKQGANVNETYYGYEYTHCWGLEIEDSGTCLTLAIEIGNDELLQLMNQQGLDINAEFKCNHRDMTAFAYYLERANINALQKVHELGADITALVEDEWNNNVTPLMQAIWLYRESKQAGKKKDRLAIVSWLLQHGVDLGYVHEELELKTVLAVVMDANDAELNQLFGLIACQAKKTLYSELTLEMSEELAPTINKKIQTAVRSQYITLPAFDRVSKDCANEWQEMGAMLFNGSHQLLYAGINQLEYSVGNAIKKLSRAERMALRC